MVKNAYIKLVTASTKQTITIDELKDFLEYYKTITSKTGEMLDWVYGENAFPYEIKQKEDNQKQWFYLWSDKDGYHAILIGVDTETVEDEDGTKREQTYVQVTLTEKSTAGDKGKANEFCKFLAKKLKAELHLFNGRVMYYNPRK